MTEGRPMRDSGMNSADQSLITISRRPLLSVTLLLVGIAVSCLLLFKSAYPFQFLPSSSAYYSPSPFFTSSAIITDANSSLTGKIDQEMYRVLGKASMEDKTVIITTLNEAWAEAGSVFDLFLESFRIGEGTERLLKHVVVICMDQRAYARCLRLHPHCYSVNSTGTDTNSSDEAYFMTPRYLHMMWTRILLLTSVLQMGFNFIFTDADIMWLRDPFPRFYPEADLQIACDYYRGNSHDITRNLPNGGFNYVKSNDRTIRFYKFWYLSRQKYPGLHDQDVLNKIKFDPFLTEIGLQIRFLDTAYFGGFCQLRDMNKVCTMHANCCFGLANKVDDLNLVLQDWKRFTSLPWIGRVLRMYSWSIPNSCK